MTAGSFVSSSAASLIGRNITDEKSGSLRVHNLRALLPSADCLVRNYFADDVEARKGAACRVERLVWLRWKMVPHRAPLHRRLAADLMDGERYYKITREQAQRLELDGFYEPWEKLGAQQQLGWDQLAAENELLSQDKSASVPSDERAPR